VLDVLLRDVQRAAMATQDPEAGRLAEQVAALRWRCLHAPADDAPHDDSPAGARTGSTAAASAAAAIIALPPPPLLPPQQPIQREPPSFGEQLFALERRWGALRKLLEAPPDIGVPGIGRGAAASPAGLLRGLLSELFRDVEALWLDAGREPAAYSLMEAVADAAMEFETEAAVAAAARAAGVPAGGGGARGGALETASAFGVARAAALAGADGARRVILSDDLWQQWWVGRAPHVCVLVCVSVCVCVGVCACACVLGRSETGTRGYSESN
jgi:hypothetical protein